MSNVRDAKPFTLAAGATVELEFDHQARADQAVLVPGVVRTGERAVAWIPGNGYDFIITFRAVMACAGIRMSP
jgi:D-amino peptidase